MQTKPLDPMTQGAVTPEKPPEQKGEWVEVTTPYGKKWYQVDHPLTDEEKHQLFDWAMQEMQAEQKYQPTVRKDPNGDWYKIDTAQGAKWIQVQPGKTLSAAEYQELLSWAQSEYGGLSGGIQTLGFGQRAGSGTRRAPPPQITKGQQEALRYERLAEREKAAADQKRRRLEAISRKLNSLPTGSKERMAYLQSVALERKRLTNEVRQHDIEFDRYRQVSRAYGAGITPGKQLQLPSLIKTLTGTAMAKGTGANLSLVPGTTEYQQRAEAERRTAAAQAEEIRVAGSSVRPTTTQEAYEEPTVQRNPSKFLTPNAEQGKWIAAARIITMHAMDEMKAYLTKDQQASVVRDRLTQLIKIRGQAEVRLNDSGTTPAERQQIAAVLEDAIKGIQRDSQLLQSEYAGKGQILFPPPGAVGLGPTYKAAVQDRPPPGVSKPFTLGFGEYTGGPSDYGAFVYDPNEAIARFSAEMERRIGVPSAEKFATGAKLAQGISTKYRQVPYFDEGFEKSPKMNVVSDFVSRVLAGAGESLAGIGAGWDALTGSEDRNWLSAWSKGAGESYRPTPPRGFLDELAEGLGSTLTFFIPGVGVGKAAQMIAKFSPKVATWTAASSAAVFESAAEAGGAYEVAMQEGMTIEQARKAAAGVFLTNLVLLPITNRFGIFDDAKGVLRRAILNAPTEGFQEAAQQVTQNLFLGKDLWEGVASSAIIGATIGAIFGAGYEIRDRLTLAERQKVVEDAFQYLKGATAEQLVAIGLPPDKAEAAAELAVRLLGSDVQHVEWARAKFEETQPLDLKQEGQPRPESAVVQPYTAALEALEGKQAAPQPEDQQDITLWDQEQQRVAQMYGLPTGMTFGTVGGDGIVVAPKQEHLAARAAARYAANGQLIGMITWHPSTSARKLRGYYTLTVRPDYRRTGIATSLLETAIHNGLEITPETVQNNDFSIEGKAHLTAYLSTKIAELTGQPRPTTLGHPLIYSALERALSSPNLNRRAPADQMLRTLKALGVKDDELKARGIFYLLTEEPGRMVTRDELIRAFNESTWGVRIEPKPSRSEWSAYATPGGTNYRDVQVKLSPISEGAPYYGGHMTQGTIFWVRTHDRGPHGETRYIDEVQSDYFGGPAPVYEMAQRHYESQKRLAAFNKEVQEAASKAGVPYIAEFEHPKRTQFDRRALLLGAAEMAVEYYKANMAPGAGAPGRTPQQVVDQAIALSAKFLQERGILPTTEQMRTWYEAVKGPVLEAVDNLERQLDPKNTRERQDLVLPEIGRDVAVQAALLAHGMATRYRFLDSIRMSINHVNGDMFDALAGYQAEAHQSEPQNPALRSMTGPKAVAFVLDFVPNVEDISGTSHGEYMTRVALVGGGVAYGSYGTLGARLLPVMMMADWKNHDYRPVLNEPDPTLDSYINRAQTRRNLTNIALHAVGGKVRGVSTIWDSDGDLMGGGAFNGRVSYGVRTPLHPPLFEELSRTGMALYPLANSWPDLAARIAIEEAIQQGKTEILITDDDLQRDRYPNHRLESTFYEKSVWPAFRRTAHKIGAPVEVVELTVSARADTGETALDTDAMMNDAANALRTYDGKRALYRIIMLQGDPDDMVSTGARIENILDAAIEAVTGYPVTFDTAVRFSRSELARREYPTLDKAVGYMARAAHSQLGSQNVRTVAELTIQLAQYVDQDPGWLHMEMREAYADAFFNNADYMRQVGKPKPYRHLRIDLTRLSRTEEAFPLFQQEALQEQPGKTEAEPDRGYVRFNKEGEAKKAVITLFETGDVDTVLHEIAHVWARWKADGRDAAILEDAFGVEKGAWTVAAEERLARSFERFLLLGEVHEPDLQPVFEKVRGWMQEIYSTAESQKVLTPVPEPARKIFERALTGRKEFVMADIEAAAKEIEGNPGVLYDPVTKRPYAGDDPYVILSDHDDAQKMLVENRGLILSSPSVVVGSDGEGRHFIALLIPPEMAERAAQVLGGGVYWHRTENGWEAASATETPVSRPAVPRDLMKLITLAAARNDAKALSELFEHIGTPKAQERTKTDAQAQEQAKAAEATGQSLAWHESFPEKIPLATSIHALKKHPLYAQAKAGDVEAAAQLVNEVLSAERLIEIAGEDPSVVIVPVIRDGGNALSAAFAGALSAVSDMEIDTGFRLQEGSKRSGAGFWSRFANPPRFTGTVRPGTKYLIVDDVSTTGGTMNALRIHIQSQGGIVVGMSALGAPRGGTIVKPAPGLIENLIKKFGHAKLNAWLAAHGIAGGDVYGLTNAEARNLLEEASLDSARLKVARNRRQDATGDSPVEAVSPQEAAQPSEKREPARVEIENEAAGVTVVIEGPQGDPGQSLVTTDDFRQALIETGVAPDLAEAATELALAFARYRARETGDVDAAFKEAFGKRERILSLAKGWQEAQKGDAKAVIRAIVPIFREFAHESDAANIERAAKYAKVEPDKVDDYLADALLGYLASDRVPSSQTEDLLSTLRGFLYTAESAAIRSEGKVPSAHDELVVFFDRMFGSRREYLSVPWDDLASGRIFDEERIDPFSDNYDSALVADILERFEEPYRKVHNVPESAKIDPWDVAKFAQQEAINHMIELEVREDLKEEADDELVRQFESVMNELSKSFSRFSTGGSYYRAYKKGKRWHVDRRPRYMEGATFLSTLEEFAQNWLLKMVGHFSPDNYYLIPADQLHAAQKGDIPWRKVVRLPSEIVEQGERIPYSVLKAAAQYLGIEYVNGYGYLGPRARKRLEEIRAARKRGEKVELRPGDPRPRKKAPNKNVTRADIEKTKLEKMKREGRPDKLKQSARPTRTSSDIRDDLMEGPNLVAVHATREAGVRAMKRMGGIPNPSVAIYPVGHAVTVGGPVALVLTADSVDPARWGSRVFDRDVFSPVQPRARWKVNKNGLYAAGIEIEKRTGHHLNMYVVSNTNYEGNAEEIVRHLREEVAMKAAWLMELGYNIEGMDVQAVRDAYYDLVRADFQQYEVFERFVEAFVYPHLSNPQLKVGGRWVPYTLENVSERMTRTKQKGGQDGVFGVKGFAYWLGVYARELKSMAAIRKEAAKIITEEEERRRVKIFGRLQDRWIKVADKAWRAVPGNFDFVPLNTAARVAVELSTKKTINRSTVKSTLEKYGFDSSQVTEQELRTGVRLARLMRDFPSVTYLEAKLQRPLGFHEIAGAVVLSNAPEATVIELSEMGIPIIERAEGWEERPLAIQRVAQRASVLFQSKRNTETPEFEKWFAGSVIVEPLAAQPSAEPSQVLADAPREMDRLDFRDWVDRLARELGGSAIVDLAETTDSAYVQIYWEDPETADTLHSVRIRVSDHKPGLWSRQGYDHDVRIGENEWFNALEEVFDIALDESKHVQPVTTSEAKPKPRVVFHGTTYEFDEFKPKIGDDIGIHVGTAAQANERLLIKGGGIYPDRAVVMPLYASIRNPLRMRDLLTWTPQNLYMELQAMANRGEGPGVPPDQADPTFWVHFPDRVDRRRQQMQAIRAHLYANGYDGIVYVNEYEVEGANRIQSFGPDPANEKRLWDTVIEEAAAKFGKEPHLVKPTDLETLPGFREFVQAYKLSRAYAKQRIQDDPVDSYIAFFPEQLKSVFNRGTFSMADPNILKQSAQQGLSLSQAARGNPDAVTREASYAWSDAVRDMVEFGIQQKQRTPKKRAWMRAMRIEIPESAPYLNAVWRFIEREELLRPVQGEGETEMQRRVSKQRKVNERMLKRRGRRGLWRSMRYLFFTNREALEWAQTALEDAQGLKRDALGFSPQDLRRGVETRARAGSMAEMTVAIGWHDDKGNKLSKGLLEIREMLEDAGINPEEWAEYRRARRDNFVLLRLEHEDPETLAMIVERTRRNAEVIEVARGWNQEALQDIDREFDNYTNLMLVEQERLGLRPPGWAEWIAKRNEDYFPTHPADSLTSDVMAEVHPMMLATPAGHQLPALGQSLDKLDPWLALARDTERIIQSGHVNQSLIEFCDLAARSPLLKHVVAEIGVEATNDPTMPEPDPVDAVLAAAGSPKEFEPQEGKDPVITLFDQGIERRFAIDPYVWAAIRGNFQGEIPAILKPFNWMANLVRALTTNKNPLFGLLFNPAIDYMGAWFARGLTPWQWSKGWWVAAKGYKSKEYREWVKAFGKLYSKGARDIVQQEWVFDSEKRPVIQAVMGKAAPHWSIKGGISWVGDRLDAMSRTMEEATRIAMYEQAKKTLRKQGKVGYEANRQAAATAVELMNFGEAGAIPRLLSSYVPYAAINYQAAVAQYRGWKASPAKYTARLMITMVLPSILEWILWHDDDDYKELPDYVKDGSFVFKIGGQYYAIRIPIEIGLPTKGFVWRTLDVLFEKEKSWDEALANWGLQAMQAYRPRVIPTAVAAVSETALFMSNGMVLDLTFLQMSAYPTAKKDWSKFAELEAGTVAGSLGRMGVREINYLLGETNRPPAVLGRFMPVPTKREYRFHVDVRRLLDSYEIEYPVMPSKRKGENEDDVRMRARIANRAVNINLWEFANSPGFQQMEREAQKIALEKRLNDILANPARFQRE